jgi:hypothetical protein
MIERTKELIELMNASSAKARYEIKINRLSPRRRQLYYLIVDKPDKAYQFYHQSLYSQKDTKAFDVLLTRLYYDLLDIYTLTDYTQKYVDQGYDYGRDKCLR